MPLFSDGKLAAGLNAAQMPADVTWQADDGAGHDGARSAHQVANTAHVPAAPAKTPPPAALRKRAQPVAAAPKVLPPPVPPASLGDLVMVWEDKSVFANQPAWWACNHPPPHAPASSDANGSSTPSHDDDVEHPSRIALSGARAQPALKVKRPRLPDATVASVATQPQQHAASSIAPCGNASDVDFTPVPSRSAFFRSRSVIASAADAADAAGAPGRAADVAADESAATEAAAAAPADTAAAADAPTDAPVDAVKKKKLKKSVGASTPLGASTGTPLGTSTLHAASTGTPRGTPLSASTGTLTQNEVQAHQAIAELVEDWQAKAPGTKITEKVNKERRERLEALDGQCAWEEGTAIKTFQAMVKAKRKARSHVRSHAKESDARMAQPSTPLDHCAQAVALAAGLHESNERVGAVAEACGLNPFSVKDWAARWRRSDSDGDRARKHGLDVAADTLAAPSLAALRKLERVEQIVELRKLHSWLKTGGALSALASASSILQGLAPHAAALLAAVRGASTRAPPAPLAPRATKSLSACEGAAAVALGALAQDAARGPLRMALAVAFGTSVSCVRAWCVRLQSALAEDPDCALGRLTVAASAQGGPASLARAEGHGCPGYARLAALLAHCAAAASATSEDDETAASSALEELLCASDVACDTEEIEGDEGHAGGQGADAAAPSAGVDEMMAAQLFRRLQPWLDNHSRFVEAAVAQLSGESGPARKKAVLQQPPRALGADPLEASVLACTSLEMLLSAFERALLHGEPVRAGLQVKHLQRVTQQMAANNADDTTERLLELAASPAAQSAVGATLRGEALRLSSRGFETVAASLARATDGVAATTRAAKLGGLLEAARIDPDHGGPLRIRATGALTALLGAIAAAEVEAAASAKRPPTYALVNAAFGATCAKLAPSQPRQVAMSEEEAVHALLGQDGELSPAQRLAINAWKARRDALVHLPTGAGKSMAFLVPALMSSGGALVVSPLRALMRSMVQALPEGVGTAAAVHGRAGALLRYAAGAARLLFVAPESLVCDAPLLRWACWRRLCAMHAIDEAHMALPEPVGAQCFRPEYGELASALDFVSADLGTGTCTRVALTATATAEEKAGELALACGLRGDYAVVSSTAVRPNLILRTLVADEEGSGGFMPAIASLLGVDLAGAGGDPVQLEAVRAGWAKLAAQPSWRRRFGAELQEGETQKVEEGEGEGEGGEGDEGDDETAGSNKEQRQRIQQLEAAESFARPGLLWFMATHDETEMAAEVCRACGLHAVHYHAGLSDSVRRAIERAWLRGALQAVCATRDSFGLGIDKSNVSLVILTEGGGLHAWSQQLGRAGRNGEKALVVTLAARVGRRAPPAPMVRPMLRAKADWALAAERQTALTAAAPGGNRWASAGSTHKHLTPSWIDDIASADGGLEISEVSWRIFTLMMGEPEATSVVAATVSATAQLQLQEEAAGPVCVPVAMPTSLPSMAAAAEALRRLLRLQRDAATPAHTLAILEGWSRGGVRDFAIGRVVRRVDAGLGACALNVHGSAGGANVTAAAQRQLALHGLVKRAPPPSVNPLASAEEARTARQAKIAQIIAARRSVAAARSEQAAPPSKQAAVPSEKASRQPPPLLFHTLTPLGAAVAASTSQGATIPLLCAAACALLDSPEVAAARASSAGRWLAQTVDACRVARLSKAAADGCEASDVALKHLLLLNFASLPCLSDEKLLWAALDGERYLELRTDERAKLDEALVEAGEDARAQLEVERRRLVDVSSAEAAAYVAAYEEQRRKAANGEAGAIAFLHRATGHPIARAGGSISAAASALAARHRDQAIVQLALGATRSHAPSLLGVRLVQPGGRSMDASASDVAAVLGALDGKDATAALHNLVDGELRLARRGVTLATMLRDAGKAAEGATARVTTHVDSNACDLAKAMASSSGPQAAQARVGTSAADLFVAGTSEALRVASKARAAGSLLRNLRLLGGGEEDGESRSWESELYQVWDVTSSAVHTEQTKLATSGDLVFVRQGRHGALSLVIVGGRAPGGPPEDEFTILIRGC